ncbi:MAG: hypothetical protein ACOXZ4_07590 [Sphaerochaetaceae bacterium]
MLGTTTPGAMRAKSLIEAAGYEFVGFSSKRDWWHCHGRDD